MMRKYILACKNRKELSEYRSIHRLVVCEHSYHFRDKENLNIRIPNMRRINFLLKKRNKLFEKRGQIGNTLNTHFNRAYNNYLYPHLPDRPFIVEHYVFSKSIADIL